MGVLDYSGIDTIKNLLKVLIYLKVVPDSINFLYPHIKHQDEWYYKLDCYCEKVLAIKRSKELIEATIRFQQSHQPTLTPEHLEQICKYQSPSSFEVDSS